MEYCAISYGGLSHTKLRDGETTIKITLSFLRGGALPWGQRGKSSKKTRFPGKHHDTKNLKVLDFGNRPNTVSESTVSNTELSELFGSHPVPGRELSDFLSTYPTNLLRFLLEITLLPNYYSLTLFVLATSKEQVTRAGVLYFGHLLGAPRETRQLKL